MVCLNPLRHEGLLRDVIEGKMQGKRPRGRPRIGMFYELKEGSYERRAEDRERWNVGFLRLVI